MRFGKLFFVVTLFAAISMTVFMVGCSSDTTTTASVNDNGYSTVQAEFGLFADSLVSQFGSSISVFEKLDGGISIAYSPINPDSSVQVGTWQVVYASDVVADYTYYLIDSLQFKANGQVQTTAVGADQMQVIRHWGVENPDTTVSYRNAEVVTSLIFSGLQGATVLVNGARHTTLQTKVVAPNNTVKRDYVINMVATNVAVPKAGTKCPQSGTIDGTIAQTIDRGSVPVTTTWQYNVTLDAGTMTGEVTAGAWSAAVSGTLCQ